jgi:hypothetical protein
MTAISPFLLTDHSGTPIGQYTITTDQRGMKRPDANEDKKKYIGNLSLGHIKS